MIYVFRDFWTFPEVLQKFLDKKQNLCLVDSTESIEGEEWKSGLFL
jgi:hypothetical protein